MGAVRRRAGLSAIFAGFILLAGFVGTTSVAEAARGRKEMMPRARGPRVPDKLPSVAAGAAASERARVFDSGAPLGAAAASSW
jgi:hypothetical protein